MSEKGAEALAKLRRGEYISPAEVSDLFQVAPITVRRWMRGGELGHCRIHGRYYVSQSDVAAFVRLFSVAGKENRNGTG